MIITRSYHVTKSHVPYLVTYGLYLLHLIVSLSGDWPSGHCVHELIRNPKVTDVNLI